MILFLPAEMIADIREHCHLTNEKEMLKKAGVEDDGTYVVYHNVDTLADDAKTEQHIVGINISEHLQIGRS